MTKTKSVKTAARRWTEEMKSALLLLSVLIFGLFLSGEAAEYVKEGLNLAVKCVIPSSFPFMIISDMYVAYGRPENIRILRRLFSALFGLSPIGIAPFICGNVGGFPIGAKMVSELYTLGALSKNEAERLLPLCNNPSCAFIIGGVGLGIYGDVRVGFLLLGAVYISTATCGIITRNNSDKNDFTDNNIRQSYNFVESVKRAGTSSIGIISFISIFSVLSGITKNHIKNLPMCCLIFSVLEVTNATKTFSQLSNFSPCLALSLSAFALGFGGICVGMQSSVFTSPSGLSMKKYYVIKLLEGALSSALVTAFFLLIK
ncbi:MAG: hypothetical protein IJW53_05855 [Clostridia bacterium]|nr:hypothetical protein [Clostridia bacterium]